MNQNIQNLRIARYISDGLGKLVELINPVANEALLIAIGQGKKEMPESVIQAIEEKLDLPKGWMGRDNHSMLMLSNLDFELCKKISGLSDDQKKALLAFIL